ncbi:hypothetical protein SELMODRAFT_421270 [Selaginella moellendorffii]|uniref:C3H1-type domain-containing protein n=1 Tax=Selaginella moellendorffii TaxID=88036 RepID=D8SEP8_SELML|nr:hypothetical protein SELMODRAFT_421270 [Selaginella moellendorffii]
MSTHTATPDPVVCRHFQRGNCRFGLHCKFLHQQVADPVSSPLQSNHNVHTSQTMLTRTATSGLRILETIANTEGPLSTAPRVRAMPSSSSSEQQGNGDKGVLQEGETESASPAQAEETEKKFREDILRYTTLLERKTHRGVSVPSCSLALLVEHIKRCSDISLASKSWLYSMIDNIPIKPCSASEQSECHLNEEEALLHYSRFTDEALSMLPNEQHKALADLHISINKVKKPTEVCVAPALVQPHRRRPRKVKKVKKVKVTEAEEEAYFSCEELFEEDATRLGLRLLHLQLVAEYVTFMAVTMYSYIKLKTARVNPLLDKLEAIKKELKKAVQDLNRATRLKFLELLRLYHIAGRPADSETSKISPKGEELRSALFWILVQDLLMFGFPREPASMALDATKGEELRARFPGVRGLLAHLGSEKLNDVIGRVCGRIAGSIAKAYGGHSSGQSFECLLTPGMNIRLIGESNDYVGKGMAGGELAIIPPEMTGFVPEDATIIHASTELLEASSVHAERLCGRWYDRWLAYFLDEDDTVSPKVLKGQVWEQQSNPRSPKLGRFSSEVLFRPARKARDRRNEVLATCLADASLIADTAQCFSAHHFACLVGLWYQLARESGPKACQTKEQRIV